MTPEDVLLTTSEVAARYRVHENTLRKWAREGRITAVSLPTGSTRKMWRYRASDVEAALAEFPADGAA
jgi:excisionase family DNA binding protein